MADGSTAGELFKAGRLKEAVEAQTAEVKARPTDPNLRLFLFELLLFSGDLDRAARQIDAIRYGEAERDSMVDRYRKLLAAENVRRKVWGGGLMPEFLTDPPFHLRMRVDALLNFMPDHNVSRAAGLLDGARQMLPTLRASVNGREVIGLHDADDLLGTVLEVLSADGHYYWLPLEQVASLAMNGPRAPRDLYWVPTRVELADGRSGEMYLEALYFGSHLHFDDAVRLGRATDWKSFEEGPVFGIGQKTYLAGDDPVGVMEWREVVVLGEVAAPPAADAGGDDDANDADADADAPASSDG